MALDNFLDRPLTSKRTPFVRRVPAIRRRQSGQSLLELAFRVPRLLLLALGVIEMGRDAYIGILVGNAARAGAAYGTQSLPQSVDTVGITTAADNDFQNNGQSVSNLTITSTVACGCDGSGSVAAAACTGTGAGMPTLLEASAGTLTSCRWASVSSTAFMFFWTISSPFRP